MGRIVVGLDGSQPSLLALEWACNEARLRHDTLELVSSWSLPAVSSAGLSDEVIEALRAGAQEAAEAGRRRAAQLAPGIEVSVTVDRGQPARILVARAHGADLLVLGSRGLGGFTALLLGSVSHACSQHSPVPVVIVRGEEAAATPGVPAA
jgi:nucleotide-binding universal stress UspA family protein